MNSDLFISQDGTYYIMKITKKDKEYEILFDKEDLNLVNQYPWRISKDGYATTFFPNRFGSAVYLNMHKLIYEKHNGKVKAGYDIDHINNNKLDNRKQNLQLLTKKENIQKAKLSKSKTGHIGIYFDKEREKFRVNYKGKYIGRFDTLEEAIRAQEEFKLQFEKQENPLKETETPKNEQQQ